jgi:hypothetical protein
VCPFCPTELTSGINFSRSQYLRHIRDFHGSDPNFWITCGFDGCPRSFKSFSYFRLHVYEAHGHGKPGNSSSQDDEGLSSDTHVPMEHDGEDHDGEDHYPCRHCYTALY